MDLFARNADQFSPLWSTKGTKRRSLGAVAPVLQGTISHLQGNIPRYVLEHNLVSWISCIPRSFLEPKTNSWTFGQVRYAWWFIAICWYLGREMMVHLHQEKINPHCVCFLAVQVTVIVFQFLCWNREHRWLSNYDFINVWWNIPDKIVTESMQVKEKLISRL